MTLEDKLKEQVTRLQREIKKIKKYYASQENPHYEREIARLEEAFEKARDDPIRAGNDVEFALGSIRDRPLYEEFLLTPEEDPVPLSFKSVPYELMAVGHLLRASTSLPDITPSEPPLGQEDHIEKTLRYILLADTLAHTAHLISQKPTKPFGPYHKRTALEGMKRARYLLETKNLPSVYFPDVIEEFNRGKENMSYAGIPYPKTILSEGIEEVSRSFLEKTCNASKEYEKQEAVTSALRILYNAKRMVDVRKIPPPAKCERIEEEISRLEEIGYKRRKTTL